MLPDLPSLTLNLIIDNRYLLQKQEDSRKFNETLIEDLGLSLEQTALFFNLLTKIIQTHPHTDDNEQENSNSVNIKESQAGQKLEQLLKSLNQPVLDKLTSYLTQLIRFAKTSSDANEIEIKDIMLSDQSYEIASKSFMGYKRTFSSNSDASTGSNYQRHSKLVAAVTDGLSGKKTDRELQTGKLAASIAIDALQNDELVRTQLDLLSKNSDANHIEMRVKNIATLISSNIHKKLLEKLHSSTIEPGKLSKLDGAATTLAFALDLDDKFALISMGDSLAFAFNQDGIIKDSINSPHITFTQQGPRLSSYLGVKHNKTHSIYSLSNNDQISIKLIDKSQVDGIVLCTDGICKNDSSQEDMPNISRLNEILKHDLQREIETDVLMSHILKEAFDNDNGDDKTITIIRKKN